MPKKIRLDKHKYDALELAAEANGGVGSGNMYATRPRGLEVNLNRPVCLYGLAHFAGMIEIREISPWESKGSATQNALYDAVQDAPLGVSYMDNDAAVERVRKQLGIKGRGRVPFAALMAELNVVRGS